MSSSLLTLTALGITLAFVHLSPPQAQAADPATAEEQIKAELGNVLQIEAITPVPETGFYRLRLSDGTLVFTDSKGKGFFVGDVFSFNGNHFVNQSEALLNKERFAELATVPDEQMIAFPAEGKKLGEMYVFTDIDCGYCRKLHNEIDEYQRSGIEVRYLAWPRCGVGAQCASYSKAVNVWCAEDQQQAMTDAKAGKRLPDKQCANPVADHFEMGRRFGLRGTPFIMLSNGAAIPGYKAAADIAELF